MDDIRKWLDDFRGKEQARLRRYGKVKPIISTAAEGRRVVAVGSRIIEGAWRTFPDFLREYLWHPIGEKWFNQELKKPAEEQHPIMRWWILYHEFSKKQTPNENGLIDAIPNGITKAFYQLAYDLYVLGHHQLLQDQVVQRLLTSGGFQGARYELFVTATMIRAGFSIIYEDESDRSKKHVEFIARHNDLGEEIAVEAKSRHREGVLGMPGAQANPQQIALRLGRLINAAVSKVHSQPLIVFVDINLPAETVQSKMGGDDIQALINTLNQVHKAKGKDLFNLILYTNHPYHYGVGDEPYDLDHLSLAKALAPKFELRNPKILDDIIIAATQYGHVPNEFPEEWDGTIP